MLPFQGQSLQTIRVQRDDIPDREDPSKAIPVDRPSRIERIMCKRITNKAGDLVRVHNFRIAAVFWIGVRRNDRVPYGYGQQKRC